MSNSIFNQSLESHRATVDLLQQHCAIPLENLSELAVNALENGKKLLFFGNGGSAADAQHLATELSIRFINNRRALAGLALTTDSSALTACANDLGFEQIFSRQIEALGLPGDIALGITTSGNSPNILRALQTAKDMGLIPAALSGGNGGKLPGLAHPLIIVPSAETARVQEMHILLGHILCTEIEHRLNLADS